ncbi:Hypothetical predicted protein [Pelobates cultripes]|uniref:Uncharacterized protein n=1 Tax=Pelobates cultripes TaxID=61616 RepID=A0AAD1WE55_PELCU|nr:Hypothetical predicted protein [Pelobates cultripes]
MDLYSSENETGEHDSDVDDSLTVYKSPPGGSPGFIFHSPTYSGTDKDGCLDSMGEPVFDIESYTDVTKSGCDLPLEYCSQTVSGSGSNYPMDPDLLSLFDNDAFGRKSQPLFTFPSFLYLKASQSPRVVNPNFAPRIRFLEL